MTTRTRRRIRVPLIGPFEATGVPLSPFALANLGASAEELETARRSPSPFGQGATDAFAVSAPAASPPVAVGPPPVSSAPVPMTPFELANRGAPAAVLESARRAPPRLSVPGSPAERITSAAEQLASGPALTKGFLEYPGATLRGESTPFMRRRDELIAEGFTRPEASTIAARETTSLPFGVGTLTDVVADPTNLVPVPYAGEVVGFGARLAGEAAAPVVRAGAQLGGTAVRAGSEAARAAAPVAARAIRAPLTPLMGLQEGMGFLKADLTKLDRQLAVARRVGKDTTELAAQRESILRTMLSDTEQTRRELLQNTVSEDRAAIDFATEALRTHPAGRLDQKLIIRFGPNKGEVVSDATAKKVAGQRLDELAQSLGYEGGNVPSIGRRPPYEMMADERFKWDLKEAARMRSQLAITRRVIAQQEAELRAIERGAPLEPIDLTKPPTPAPGATAPTPTVRPVPTQAGALQAGMGIGERPAQGQLLGEFQGRAPPPVPLIDAEQQAARAAAGAQEVAGQTRLPWEVRQAQVGRAAERATLLDFVDRTKKALAEAEQTGGSPGAVAELRGQLARDEARLAANASREAVAQGQTALPEAAARTTLAPPPPAPGYTRLFRGESAIPFTPKAIEESTGRWFTDKETVARYFAMTHGRNGRITYIDVPKDAAQTMFMPQRSLDREYLVPTEMIGQKQVFSEADWFAAPATQAAPPPVAVGPLPTPQAVRPLVTETPPAVVGPPPAAAQAIPPAASFSGRTGTLTPPPSGTPPTAVGPLPAGTGGAPPTRSPTAGGAPPSEPGGFAANIRLSKYPEDIRSTIQTWAAEHPEEVQAARRGVRSDAQVLEDAKTLAEDMGGDFTKLQRRWKPGEAWNAEEVTAIRGALRAKTETVIEAATAAKVQNSAANHANLLIALEDQARLQEVVHGVTAEAGRALRAFRQEAFDAIKANDTRRLEELLRRIGSRENMDDIATKIANLPLNNPVAVNNFLRSITKPKLWDYIMEIYINSILSGPKTHIINELSNLVNMVVSPAERLVAAGVERPLALMQRRRVERFFSEVPADAFGAMAGVKEGVTAGLATIKNGITPSQASKWEFRRTAFKGWLGRVIRAPGTALEAADAMNYAMDYRAALNAGIVRKVRSEGLRGEAFVDRIAELKANPVEALGAEGLMKEAARVAEYRLFRQPPGKITSLVSQVRVAFPPLRFVIPFLNTPVNLLKFGLERSPLGVFNPSLWRNLAAKSPEASDQIARVFLGSALAALIAWHFKAGNITGAAPTNAAERDRFYREGKLPFAINIGGKWVQYQRLEPFNQPIAQVAAALAALEAKDKTVGEKMGAASLTIGENLVSQTYLSSLNDLFDALARPEQEAESFLVRIGSAAVPASSAVRTAAQIADPTIRKPATVAERLQVGIPGLSQNVPPKLTAFGEEAQRQSPAWSPIQVSSEKQGSLDAELGRLGIEVGFVGGNIAVLERLVGDKKLTPEQKQQYQVSAGRLTKERLTVLMGLDAYKDAEDDAKKRAIQRVVDGARQEARAELVQSIVEEAKSAPPKPRPPQPAPRAPVRNPVPAGAFGGAFR